MSFQVVAYGGDGGGLNKFVSTDGTNFSLVSGSTASDAMGNYKIPLPTGTSQVFFRLTVNPGSGIFGGIIVDNFHAELFTTPQSPVILQEGGGSVCIFNDTPFFPGCSSVPSLSFYGLIALALLMAGSAVWMFRKKMAA